MKDCKTCMFFRPYRSISDLIAAEITMNNDSQLSNAIVELSREERRSIDSEVAKCGMLMGQELTQWDIQPKFSSYCGLMEENSVYFICAMKNPGQDCTDHNVKELDEKCGNTCNTCNYKVIADGNLKDRERLNSYAQLMQQSAVLGRGASNSDYNTYKGTIAASKIVEANQAFYFEKFNVKPQYLSICKKRSSAEEFHICILENKYNRCSDHSSGTRPASNSGQDTLGNYLKRLIGKLWALV